MSDASSQGDSRVGQGMLWLAAIGVLVMLTLGFQSMNPSGPTMTAGVDSTGRSMVVIEQGQGGHYFAKGTINGESIGFLVDTGATDVAIAESIARAMGLDFGPRITVQTAAGPAPAWLTRLDSVSVGGLERRNVRATITPGLGEEALLGMSFLRHFSLRQEGGNLIISSGDSSIGSSNGSAGS